MTTRPARIVDAHVHLWDPARTDWYPYLTAGRNQLNMGDVSGMARRFDVATYRAESAGWNVEKLVNVAAATGRHSVAETLELDVAADRDGHPDAIVGGLPPSEGSADAVALLDRQSRARRFRGVRPMGAVDGPVPVAAVLNALAERSLIFEVMAHPDQLRTAANALAAHDGLTVVLEHTGWPRDDSAAEQRLWADGIRAMADLGGNVVCKLSGLAMPLGSMAADVQGPWIEQAIDVFGADRCMFASNFPVDGLHGTLDDLWSCYSAITAGLDARSRDALFAGTAERVYRL